MSPVSDPVPNLLDDNDDNSIVYSSDHPCASVRRLPDSDVRAIFECLHENKEVPSHLHFHIVPPVAKKELKLSPPAYEFPDGLYVLLKPLRKRKNLKDTDRNSMIPYVSEHLRHLLIDPPSDETCEWQLSGPQFPPPTAIQQRYCYPKGPEEYSSRKGGALWTMYAKDGKEDLEFRLLHVYFSAKRALNKGIDSKPTNDVTLRTFSSDKYQHHQAERDKRQNQSINISSSVRPTRRRIDETPYLADERCNGWESQHSPVPLQVRQDDDLSHSFSPVQQHRSNDYFHPCNSTAFYQNINYTQPFLSGNASAPFHEIQTNTIFRSHGSVQPTQTHEEKSFKASSSQFKDVMYEATMSFSFSEDSLVTNAESVSRDLFDVDLDNDDCNHPKDITDINDRICIIQNPVVTDSAPARFESLSKNLDLFKQHILCEIMNEPDQDQPVLLNKLIVWGQQLAGETVNVDSSSVRSQSATPTLRRVPDHNASGETNQVHETCLEIAFDTLSEIAVSRSDLDNDIDSINNYNHNDNRHDIDNESHFDCINLKNLNDEYDNYPIDDNNDNVWVTIHSSSSSV